MSCVCSRGVSLSCPSVTYVYIVLALLLIFLVPLTFFWFGIVIKEIFSSSIVERFSTSSNVIGILYKLSFGINSPVVPKRGNNHQRNCLVWMQCLRTIMFLSRLTYLFVGVHGQNHNMKISHVLTNSIPPATPFQLV